MKHELSCAVAQNLMTLSVEGLTEKETEDALQAHIETCEECRAIYESMKADADAEPLYVDETKIFKKTRRKIRIRLVAAVLAVCLLCSGAWIFSMWYHSDSVLKIDQYDMMVEKIPLEDFRMVKAGGGDMLAHLNAEGADPDDPYQQPFLIRSEEYAKLKRQGYAYMVHFLTDGTLKISNISDCYVENDTLHVLLWSYHDQRLFGRERLNYEQSRLIYDDFSSIYNEADEEEQPNVTWMSAPVTGTEEPG